VAVHATLASLSRGAADPCYRRVPDGTVWRATRTPDGPVLLRLEPRASVGEVEASAWGPGADWALDGVPDLLGACDDPTGFVPDVRHPRLVSAWRTRPGWRVTRTRAVLEALVAAALEQRVTGVEARRAWRMLIEAYGEPAPGPAARRSGRAGGHGDGPVAGMRVLPTPQEWRRIPSWAWMRAGVDEARRRVVLAACAAAGRLEQTVDLDMAEVETRLRTLPGVGVWTAAEVRQRAHGDADAFSFGDFHVARNVSWALTSRVMDDAGCAALIEQYRGHRYRVQRLLELDGAVRPRRGPRMNLPTHLPGTAGGLLGRAGSDGALPGPRAPHASRSGASPVVR
jgi:3-methyladenine DNA glycosylase/8-oxoguanine DNA glycosylase